MLITVLSMAGGHLKGQEKNIGRGAGRLEGGRTVTYPIPRHTMAGRVGKVETSWVAIPVSATRLKNIGDLYIKKNGEKSPFEGEQLRTTTEGLSMEVSFRPDRPGANYRDVLEIWSRDKNRREFVVFMTGRSSAETSVEKIGLSNAPNPFQQTTTISFDLPHTGETSLHIYNAMGLLVKTVLANEQLEPGRHAYVVDGTDMQDGVYVYRLLFDNGTAEMSKMVRLK